MLLDNLDNTFVTPVFNGSTSLRDAAGQMIENVTKSVKRKETVDDAYISKLYEDVTSLYRLDQIGGRSGLTSAERGELGPLPAASVVLLSVLCCVWALIVTFAVYSHIKKRKKRQNED